MIRNDQHALAEPLSSRGVSERDDSAALRALAQALAPYLREIFDGTPVAPAVPADEYDDQLRRLVTDLPREITEYALVLFDALRVHPNRIDLPTLAKQLGAANGREVSGILLTPFKRRAKQAGMATPPWQDDQRPGGYRVLEDPTGGEQSELLYRKLLEHQSRNRWAVQDLKDVFADEESRRPLPSSVYVWAPEFFDDDVTDGAVVESSCLRTDRPGTRAVVYRAHHDPGIVALFDVATMPAQDPADEWNYTVGGCVHMLKTEISHAELVSMTGGEGIFGTIQGRRRIPTNVQPVLAELLLKHLAHDEKAPLSMPVFDADGSLRRPRRPAAARTRAARTRRTAAS